MRGGGGQGAARNVVRDDSLGVCSVGLVGFGVLELRRAVRTGVQWVAWRTRLPRGGAGGDWLVCRCSSGTRACPRREVARCALGGQSVLRGAGRELAYLLRRWSALPSPPARPRHASELRIVCAPPQPLRAGDRKQTNGKRRPRGQGTIVARARIAEHRAPPPAAEGNVTGGGRRRAAASSPPGSSILPTGCSAPPLHGAVARGNSASTGSSRE